MKKSKIILIILAAALLTALTAFAVSSADDVMMTFDKGTEDDVSGMPETGTIDGAYLVPDNVPEREGYEFLYWKLDYGAKTSYTVHYYIEGTDTELIPSVTVTDVKAFDTIIREAEVIDGYSIVSGDVQSITLDVDESKNVFTFYYKKATPASVTYMVQYLDLSTFSQVFEDKYVTVPYGEFVTEVPPEKDDYLFAPDFESFYATEDGRVITFYYLYIGGHDIG